MTSAQKNPEQLITQHLDIWTSAIKQRSSAGRGSSKKTDLYGIKQLRKLILDLAVRGHLTNQEAADEPAIELLKQIRADQKRLEQEGIIKKSKPIPPVSPAETSFALPKKWEWVRLGNLMEMFNGRAFKQFEWSSSGTPIVRIQNLNDRTAPFNYFEGELEPKNQIDDGSFLISWSGTPGTSFGAFIWDRGPGALNQHINNCLIFGPETNKQYLKLAVNSCMDHLIANAQGGVGLKHVTKGTLNNIVFGLPPKQEQIRIVESYNKLMSLCDQLEQQTEASLSAHQTLVETLLGALTNASSNDSFQQAWQRIAQHFDTLFTTEHSVDQLKQTILQLAVMGKLVPQDPSDEPASELLKRIAAEKAELVKLGIIRTSKVIAEPVFSETSFPPGWETCPYGSVINLISGQHLKPEEYFDSKEPESIPYLTGPAEFGNNTPLPTRFTNERRSIAKEGDILITCKGSGVGKTNVADQDIFISRQLMAIQPILINPDFTLLIANSLTEYLRENIVGIAIPGISREDILEAPIKLPPLEEQSRIIEKVNAIMNICDRLKDSLANAQATKLLLADSISSQSLMR